MRGLVGRTVARIKDGLAGETQRQVQHFKKEKNASQDYKTNGWKKDTSPK